MTDTDKADAPGSEPLSPALIESDNLPSGSSAHVNPEPEGTKASSQGAQSREGTEDNQHNEATTEPESRLQIPAAHDEESSDSPPGPLPPTIDTSTPTIGRQNSEAIGPDLPTPMLQNFPQTGPLIQFILLLASVGTRHPFQLNEKYLAKRNVNAMGMDGNFDPSVISVYNLKELIFKDWRDDWETKPSSPSAIRLIYFGQLLADNTNLKECRIKADGTANVLHISIKPQEAMDDDDAGKAGKPSISRDREGSSSGRGCRCIVM